MARERPDLRLAAIGGVTNRITDEGLGETFLYGLHHLPEVLSCLGSLRNHEQFLHAGESRNLLCAFDGVGLAMSIAHQAHDLRVVLVPHDDGVISLLGMSADNGLHPGHAGAGGIPDPQTRRLDATALRRGDAVRPNDDGPAFEAFDTIDGLNPFG